MGVVAGEEVLVGSTAQELADAIARVYEDRDLWNSLSKSGIKRAEANWGSRAAWRDFKFALEKLDFAISDPAKIELYKP
jgi:glycosyltransferase involved in cell wall biosynthesis